MASVKVVTDSGSDLPSELSSRYDIQVVPLTIHFGEAEFRDGFDLTAEEFYERLGSGDVMPRTTQPSPVDFERVYRSLREAGHEVVSVHLSSQLSGTVQSASLAARSVGGGVEVIDSQSASLGVGLLALAAARQAEKGAGTKEIAAELTRLRDKLSLFFSVHTLEYLQRNGRIGKAQALAGTLLNIKPILMLKDGLVHPVERTRGKSKALSRLLTHVENAAGPGPLKLAVLHGHAPAEAEQLAESLRARLEIEELFIASLGPTIGTHAGPGTLGVVCYAST